MGADEEALKLSKLKRGYKQQALTKLFKSITATDCADKSVEALSILENRLKTLFTDYENLSMDTYILGDSDTSAAEVCEENYLRNLTILRELIHKKSSQPPLSSPSCSHSRNSETKTKLPVITIPVFNGKSSEYKTFIGLFESLIHNDKSLDDIKKLYYLRNFVKDEPYNLIINLPLVGESYSEALKILKERYDNKYKIINDHVNSLLDLQPITKSTAANIREFVCTVKQQLAALKNLDQCVDAWDQIIVCILTRKLDLYSNREYQLDRDFNVEPTVKQLIDFLEKRALALENAESASRGGHSASTAQRIESASSSKKCPASASVSNVAIKHPAACAYCKCEHKLYNCPKFKLCSSSERNKFAVDNQLCNICLNKHAKKCRFYFKCNTCNGKHNTLLHEDEQVQSTVSMVSGVSNTQVLLPTVQVKLLAVDGTEVRAKALLDSGSQNSFVTSDLARRLGLKPKTINSRVIGIGNASSTIKESVHLKVQSVVSSYQMSINCYVIEHITSKIPQTQIDISAIKIPSQLSLADANFDTPSNIQILMAADVFFQALLPQPEQHKNEPSALCSPVDPEHQSASPYLLNTRFGVVIAGTIPNLCHNQKAQKESISLFCQSCNNDINDTIKGFWKAESVPEIFPERRPEFEQTEKYFQETVEFNNNQFQVSLPLKVPLSEINEMLGDSLHLAIKRFQSLEKRLQKDSDLYKQYKFFIDEYIALGHGTYSDIDKYNLTSDPIYFLPHHAVLRPDKKTTKCRVVFDASMLTSQRRSLNDLLLNGPTVQKELFDILLLFRLGAYVFSTDLKQMFRCILLDPRHRPLQLILWRESPSENIKCIELNTVTYGFKCSTFLATRCLIELASRYTTEFPAAAFILKNQTYCDDILVSSNCLESLSQMKDQLIMLLSLGGFQAHKWSSNAAEILQDIPKEKQHFDDFDIQKENYYIKTLGVTYNTKTDTFKISSPCREKITPLTKREIVSYVARFYDPLGLAGPLTVSAKIIVQKLWAAHINWDSSLPDDLKNTWLEFYNSLLIMSPIHVIRNVTLLGPTTTQLVGYADASNTAYGCCLYLREVDQTGNVKITLLCSKSRLAPLSQKLTTPRLELNAVLLLAKLVHRVYSLLSLKLHFKDVLLFSDSQIVLAWLKIDFTKLNTYVANRVKMVSEYAETFSWYYVSTGDNPADCLSRGVQPHELQQNMLWWQGPSYLHNSKYTPPETNINKIVKDLPELKTGAAELPCSSAMICSVDNINSLNLEFLNKFSTITKMNRVLTYVRRFCNNLNPQSTKIKLNYLTSAELNDSLLLIVKYEQQNHFPNEISLLKQNKPVIGSLKPLNPFIDGNGMLRVGGRLDSATIPNSQKHPVILPNKSRVTQLIVTNEHVKNLHAGQKLILSSLNQRFWLINGIKEIKKIIHSCIICFRLKAQVANQLMGSLPPDRVNISRPFQRVGVDFAGPISIKQSRIRRALVSKGYICVFVCFTTKAVHLEIVSNLTTAAFLACFKRFVSRRGLPSDVYCDNASNFKGARNQLDELYKLQNSTDHRRQVQSQTAEQGINFHFIPSYSPVFGGLWEAAVKSTKFHLKRVTQKALLTFEELCTVLCQIESTLNSRPLTPMSTDIDDYSYLTPGHFLIGCALNAYPDKNVIDTPVNRLKFWNICCNMFQSFWKVWSKHYLNVLQCRPKWRNSSDNIKVGSLVILKEDNTSPLHWPMARVANVFPGSDNRVRTVELRTPNGKTHRRAVSKICLLPIDCT